MARETGDDMFTGVERRCLTGAGALYNDSV